MWAISDFVLVQSIGDPRDGRGKVASMPTCGPFLILSAKQSIGNPRDGRCSLATVPTCGPFLILSSCRALGTPKTAGLGSHCAHMWAISDFVLVQSIGDPETAGVR